jgi:hypothetical protein
MIDPDKHLEAKLSALLEGLRRNDPLFCGAAPAWVVETVLRNLDAATARPHQAEWVRDFATGGIRFVADQDAAGCDALLGRLSELLEAEG